MTENSPVQRLQKLSRMWTQRREKEIAVRIYYDVRQEGKCKIYCLQQVDELE